MAMLLVIKNIRAYDLKDVRKGPFKMKVQAIGCISNNRSITEETGEDETGETNPQWDSVPMNFTIDESTLERDDHQLIFQLWCNATFGMKPVGKVCLGLKDLFERVGGEGGSGTLTCRVNHPKKQGFRGTFKFSYQFRASDGATEAHNEGVNPEKASTSTDLPKKRQNSAKFAAMVFFTATLSPIIEFIVTTITDAEEG